MRTPKQLTPLGAITSGLVAGLVGTVCMDTVRFLRQRRSGGERNPLRWEFAPVRTWKAAPDPGQVGKRLIEGFTQRELPDAAAWPVSTFMHWSYGAFYGALYGVVAGSVRKPPSGVYGVPFGAVVWISGYIALPIAGLYEPIWKYDSKTLADDLGPHLVYGAATGTVFGILAKARTVSVQPRPNG
ncbi:MULTISPECIES: hypothetical protein [unclassified Streptomyces]|uniref:hypothetical protein n=1 Tax=unclassified Streptomyces TaxID=2593676 RepID=UPI0033C8F56C